MTDTPTPVSKLEGLINDFGIECYQLGRQSDWLFKATAARQAILDHVAALVAEAAAPDSVEIHMTPVKSSNIASVGYRDATETLQVEFKDGAVYSYADVPRYVYDGFMEADSLGAFFAKQIRNEYATVRLK